MNKTTVVLIAAIAIVALVALNVLGNRNSQQVASVPATTESQTSATESPAMDSTASSEPDLTQPGSVSEVEAPESIASPQATPMMEGSPAAGSSTIAPSDQPARTPAEELKN